MFIFTASRQIHKILSGARMKKGSTNPITANFPPPTIKNSLISTSLKAREKFISVIFPSGSQWFINQRSNSPVVYYSRSSSPRWISTWGSLRYWRKFLRPVANVSWWYKSVDFRPFPLTYLLLSAPSYWGYLLWRQG